MHRDGVAELVLYHAEDPDTVCDSVTLQPDERVVVGELLALPPEEIRSGARTHQRRWRLMEDRP
ncbi:MULTISPECIES: hypothetical protein [Micromonospora]|uniref:hypothetical protein n=1 Tax=Micromonospora TaxID=1873 RepID=UPI0001BF170F|nr:MULTISPECIES: hypothetical protein [Micromonospora]